MAGIVEQKIKEVSRASYFNDVKKGGYYKQITYSEAEKTFSIILDRRKNYLVIGNRIFNMVKIKGCNCVKGNALSEI